MNKYFKLQEGFIKNYRASGLVQLGLQANSTTFLTYKPSDLKAFKILKYFKF